MTLQLGFYKACSFVRAKHRETARAWWPSPGHPFAVHLSSEAAATAAQNARTSCQIKHIYKYIYTYIYFGFNRMPSSFIYWHFVKRYATYNLQHEALVIRNKGI